MNKASSEGMPARTGLAPALTQTLRALQFKLSLNRRTSVLPVIRQGRGHSFND